MQKARLLQIKEIEKLMVIAEARKALRNSSPKGSEGMRSFILYSWSVYADEYNWTETYLLLKYIKKKVRNK